MKKISYISVVLFLLTLIPIKNIRCGQFFNPTFLKDTTVTNLPKQLLSDPDDKYIRQALQYPLITGYMVIKSGLLKNFLLFAPKESACYKIANLLFQEKTGSLELSSRIGQHITNVDKLGDLIAFIMSQPKNKMPDEQRATKIKDLLNEATAKSELKNNSSLKKNIKTIAGHLTNVLQNPDEKLAAIYFLLALAVMKIESNEQVTKFCNAFFSTLHKQISDIPELSRAEEQAYNQEELENKLHNNEQLSFEEAAAINLIRQAEQRSMPKILQHEEIPVPGMTTQHFSDCVENTLHNIIRLLSYDYSTTNSSTKQFSLDRLRAYLPTNHALPQALMEFISNNPSDVVTKQEGSNTQKEKIKQKIHTDWNTTVQSITSKTPFSMYSGVVIKPNSKSPKFEFGSNTSYIFIPKPTAAENTTITIEDTTFTIFDEQNSDIKPIERTSFILNFFVLLDAILSTKLFESIKTLEDITNNYEDVIRQTINKLNALLHGVAFRLMEPAEVTAISPTKQQDNVRYIELSITPDHVPSTNKRMQPASTTEAPFLFRIGIEKHRHTAFQIEEKKIKQGCILSNSKDDDIFLQLLCQVEASLLPTATSFSLLFAKTLFKTDDAKLALLKHWATNTEEFSDLATRLIPLLNPQKENFDQLEQLRSENPEITESLLSELSKYFLKSHPPVAISQTFFYSLAQNPLYEDLALAIFKAAIDKIYVLDVIEKIEKNTLKSLLDKLESEAIANLTNQLKFDKQAELNTVQAIAQITNKLINIQKPDIVEQILNNTPIEKNACLFFKMLEKQANYSSFPAKIKDLINTKKAKIKNTIYVDCDEKEEIESLSLDSLFDLP